MNKHKIDANEKPNYPQTIMKKRGKGVKILSS